jgi:hypothetical protein
LAPARPAPRPRASSPSAPASWFKLDANGATLVPGVGVVDLENGIE